MPDFYQVFSYPANAGRDFQHFNGLVQTLMTLKRQTDLKFGYRLLDMLEEALRKECFSITEFLALSGQIQEWINDRLRFFLSEEFRFRRWERAITQGQDRRLAFQSAAIDYSRAGYSI